jgi:hypothetical protein
MKELGPWITLLLLGGYHGLNPGMGWLFAVAIGLQDRSRRAVVRAFAPIALGHAASIAVVVALVAALQSVLSPTLLRWVGAGTLVSFGLYKLAAPMSCPRWVGMRVGFRELTAWSFLMATGCGAGMMLVPVILKLPSDARPIARVVPAAYATTEGTTKPVPTGLSCHREPADTKQTAAAASGSGSTPHSGETPRNCHAQIAQMAKRGGAGPLAAAAAVLLHTLTMFLVMAAIALVVYEKVGLAILRRAWFNLDLVWAGALIAAGLLTFVV